MGWRAEYETYGVLGAWFGVGGNWLWGCGLENALGQGLRGVAWMRRPGTEACRRLGACLGSGARGRVLWATGGVA